MVALRKEFISKEYCPEGTFIVPASCDFQEMAQLAANAIHIPENSAVIIPRSYSNLSEMATQVFSKINPALNSIAIPAATMRADETMSVIRRDFFTMIDVMEKSHSFASIELNASRYENLESHIDTVVDFEFSPRSKSINGSVILLQSFSDCGTGIYCNRELREKGISPRKYIDWWSYEVGDAEQSGIDPYYARPGDLVLLRQNDWPEFYPPSVHTSPVCNIDESVRTAMISFGYKKLQP